jgi:STE24 endopeptidase
VANEDKATRYHRLRRRASLTGTLSGALLLLILLVSGGSAALGDASSRLAGGSSAGTLFLYVTTIALLYELIQAPLAFYLGVTLERRYGLSTQTAARWWRDHLKSGGIALVFAWIGSAIVWSLLSWSPGRWWISAAAAFAAMLVLMALLAPVLLLPLFYEFKPLDRATLAARLLTLAERAGARVLGVFEWRLSDRTRKANAALTGIGRTRRILISDTLLAEHSDDEIEVILAHELAHHVHRDIWSAIALETVLIVLGFFVADRVLSAFATSFGLTGKADIAALPLLLVAMGGVSLALKPLANAFSRAHERRADRYALAMTGNAAAFVSAMKRLAAQNLAEERPSRIVELLFHGHPSTTARIAAAQTWAMDQAKTTSPPGFRVSEL